MNDDNEKKKKTPKKDKKKETSSVPMDTTGDDDGKNPTAKSPSNDNTNKNKNKKEVVVPTYEERCLAVNAISYPLASKKTTKKCHKLVRKASSIKHIRRGVKEVIKGIRKGETGLVVMAGDIYPIDVISHIPILLEEHNIPYIFVPSKFDLGAAACTKRPTSCVLIKKEMKSKAGNTSILTEDAKEIYDAIYKEAKEYDPSTTIVLKN